MQKIFSFKNRTAIVTGGARGIGLAIAEALVASGGKVHCFDRDTADASASSGIVFQDVDISDSRAVHEAIGEVGSTPDLLVNNAGITRDRSIAKMSDEDWADVLNVNLTGSFNMIRAVAPLMGSAGFGRIVNITSINGMRGKFGQANYTAAKAGLIGLSKTLAREHSLHGITFNVVCPGPTDTALLASVTDGAANPEKLREAFRRAIPMGRLGEADDLAGAVLFFASDDASFVTGTSLAVDGGYLSV